MSDSAKPHWATAAFRNRNGGPTHMEGRYPENVRLAWSNPEEGLLELDKIDAEDSLLKFIEITWPILEPGRKFIRGWVIEAICDHLEAVSRGEIRKLLINVPPGCMKSLTTSVFWPAWEWGPRNMPQLRYLCASYSHDLTIRDNRRCRQILTDPIYQQHWSDRFKILSDQDAKVKFENNYHGWKQAISVGGTTTGERGDRFIVDDPHNVKTAESLRIRESTLQWFTEVVPTRVNDPENSVFVVIMQRVHERDVSGLILGEELGYEVLCLPMEYENDHPTRSTIFIDPRKVDGELLWPERFSERYLEEDLKPQLRSWGGSYAEAGQLQQRPAPRGGGMFKRSWWRFFETNATGYHLGRPHSCFEGEPEKYPEYFSQVILSCDASFKKTDDGSRVSLLVLGILGPFIYVLDNFTKFMDFPETIDKIAKFEDDENPFLVTDGLMFKWPQCKKLIIEDKANGSAIIDTLRLKISGTIPVNPRGGKDARASAIQPRVESGHVLLPDGAPWLEDFISEFASFPVAGKDDQVDSLSQGIMYLTDGVDVTRALNMADMS